MEMSPPTAAMGTVSEPLGPALRFPCTGEVCCTTETPSVLGWKLIMSLDSSVLRARAVWEDLLPSNGSK